jgi:hypothetical protein
VIDIGLFLIEVLYQITEGKGISVKEVCLETGRYDAVTLIYYDYGALIPTERRMLLNRVFQALKPGGLFIFDVFSEQYMKRRPEHTACTFYQNGGFWKAEPYLCLDARYHFQSNLAEVRQAVVITERGVQEYLIWDTAFSGQSLTDEVLPFGFSLRGLYGDVFGNPCSEQSDSLCAVFMK